MDTQLNGALARDVVIAGNSPQARRTLLGRLGPDPVARLLVNELGVRRAPWKGSRGVLVEYHLTWRDQVVTVPARYGPAGSTDPVRVSADLDELWAMLYGTGDPSPAGAIRTVEGPPAACAQLRSGLYDEASLAQLAVRFDCDKWGLHYYAPRYERHFAPRRTERLTILEIGVGGADEEGVGGNSLRMWKRFFPRALLYGIDIFDKSWVDEPRITTFQGDQSDPGFLDEVLAQTGVPDIVIDDGSHVNAHVIASFRHLFPRLAPDGLYAVEDLQTAYWPRFGGSSTDLTRPDTSINLLKGLIDGLNYQELVGEVERPVSYTDRHVTGLHCYHNLAVIDKGENAEGTILDVFPNARERALGPMAR